MNNIVDISQQMPDTERQSKNSFEAAAVLRQVPRSQHSTADLYQLGGSSI